MWNPEIDCKYFNQCGKCFKVSSCATVGSISAVDAKEFDMIYIIFRTAVAVR